MANLGRLKPVTAKVMLLWFSVSSGNAVAQDGARPLGFVAELQSGSTLQGVAPELGEALLSIASLADEYANLTPVDLEDMANAETGEDKGLFHVTVREAEGLTKEFWYNLKNDYLSSVKVTRGDGRAVAVSMTKYTIRADEQEILSWPDLESTEELADGRWLRATIREADGSEKVYLYNRQVPELSWISNRAADGSSGGAALRFPGRRSELRLTAGIVIQPGGTRRLVVYYDRGVSRFPTWAALHDAENGEGIVTIWGVDGVMVAECEVNNQPIPEFMIQEANAKLTAEQFDAVDLPARDRLVVSPAFKNAEIGLQRKMENIIAWSDRYGQAKPSDLPYLFPGGHEQVTQIETGDDSAFRVTGKDDEQDWSYHYDRGTGALKKVERDTFAIYFDPQYPGYPVGGRGSDSVEDRVWLISLYPVTCAPRMAIAATGESPTDIAAKGKVYVWAPDGSALVETEIQFAKSVSDVVQELGATLTHQQKIAIDWRGPQESTFLLGEY